ncbi:MAG: hypothetical protein ACI8YQ_000298 [Polaribacter sp.]|jgi:hypothetical protein
MELMFIVFLLLYSEEELGVCSVQETKKKSSARLRLPRKRDCLLCIFVRGIFVLDFVIDPKSYKYIAFSLSNNKKLTSRFGKDYVNQKDQRESDLYNPFHERNQEIIFCVMLRYLPLVCFCGMNLLRRDK